MLVFQIAVCTLKNYLLILLLAFASLSYAQTKDDSLVHRQARARLTGFTYTTSGKSAIYPYPSGHYVLDSFVIKYRARRSSQFDYRTLGYFPSWDWENPYLPQRYFPDLYYDLMDSFQTADLYANRVHYDTFHHYHRDTFGHPFLDFARINKSYIDDTTEKLYYGQYETLPAANYSDVKKLTLTYMAQQVHSVRLDSKVPGGWRYTARTMAYDNNKLIEDTVRNDSTVQNSRPYRELYHYTPFAVVDTVKTLRMNLYGSWILTEFKVIEYDNLGRISSFASYFLSSKPDSFYTYSRIHYRYKLNSNHLIVVDKSLNDNGQGLSLTSLEQRHLNDNGLPDSVWYRGYYYYDYVKVLSYDSLDNPVSIAVYSVFVPQRSFSKIYELRYYYELVPAIRIPPPDSTATIVESFYFFPNPTGGRFTICAPEAGSLRWLDILGKTVAIFRIDKGKHEYIVSAAAGIYLGIYFSDDASKQELVRICLQP
jgi:hypothetical protein